VADIAYATMMSALSKSAQTITAVLLCWSLPLSAQTVAPAPSTDAGHYYLQGVMETGSELLLTPEGWFQWYLSVGALDLFAEGRWRNRDGKIVLIAEKTKDVPKPAFKQVELTPKDGTLVPPDGQGAYVRPGPSGD
jgi:hypothetical protein